MSRRLTAALSAVMYFISFTAFFCLVGIDILPKNFSHLVKFITAFLVFACGYGASAVRCASEENPEAVRRLMRRTLCFLFAAYLVAVLDFMLIDNSFGRSVSNIFGHSSSQLLRHLRENTNLVPFATVRLFWRGYRNGWVSLSAFAENIAGNIAVFMPFAFFMPLIFPKINRFRRFFFAISAVVISVELLQVLLLTGSADIDDYILNVAGAVLAFGFFGLKPVGRFLRRVTFGVWETNEAG